MLGPSLRMKKNMVPPPPLWEAMTGLETLCFSRVTGPVFLRKRIALRFSR